jgi:hypothetical protein
MIRKLSELDHIAHLLRNALQFDLSLDPFLDAPRGKHSCKHYLQANVGIGIVLD